MLAPDYIGLGYNHQKMHPYFIGTKENALSGIYMLPAANDYLKRLNIDLSDIPHHDLFISSYSEGAGYALKTTELLDYEFADILSNLKLKLLMTFSVSGSYSLQKMIDYMYSNVDSVELSSKSNWNTNPSCTRDGVELCKVKDGWSGIANVRINLALYKIIYSLYFFSSLSQYNKIYSIESFVNENISKIRNCVKVNFNSGEISEEFQVKDCKKFYPEITNVSQFNDLFTLPLSSEYFSLIISSLVIESKYFINESHTLKKLLNLISKNENNFNNINIYSSMEFAENKTFFNNLKKITDTYDINTTTPIEVLSLKYDSVVPNINSTIACNSEYGIKVHKSATLVCKQLDNTKFWSYNYGDQTTYLEHKSANNFFMLHEVQMMNKLFSTN